MTETGGFRRIAPRALAGLALLAGCWGDRTGVVLDIAPRIDTQLSLQDHFANAGQLFSLDVGPFLSDDQDEPWDLVCEVAQDAPGSFDGQVYKHTFTAAGTYYVVVRVTDSTLNVTESYFRVNVDFVGNAPPEVPGVIPQQTAYLGVDFYFNLGDYVTDDIDPVTELDYSTGADPSPFMGPVYHAVFDSPGTVTVDFAVTDSGGKTASGSFSVRTYDQPGLPLDFPEGTVFVSPAGSDATGDGSMQSPYRSIGAGIVGAESTSGASVVVACGVYTETVTLMAGIDVLGGYDTSFTMHDLAGLRAMILPGGNLNYTVLAQGIAEATVFEGFVVQGPTVTAPGTSSLAVKVVDSGKQLQILGNLVYAGRGGDGQRGTDGTDGRAGAPGSPGNSATTDSVGPNPNPGGKGATFSDSGYDVSGGDGGYADAPLYNNPEQRGLDGLAAPGVTAGLGGAPGHASMFASGPVLVSPSGWKEGQPGTDGGRGDDGGSGAGGTGDGVMLGGEWLGATGEPGTDGLPGGGGGGGGAGGGADDPDGIMMATLKFVIGATGGVGGAGGAGGAAGTGAAGGPGADGGSGQYESFWVGAGGPGGNGGAGGHGGGGGGGAGGMSAAILVNSPGATSPPDYSENTFLTGAGRGGAGGAGGYSGGFSGEAGADGAVYGLKVF